MTMVESSAATILLVDDHPLVRKGVESLVERHYRVIGSADSVSSSVELIRERHPDIVLLDVRIPGGGGSAVVEEVRRFDPDVKFLVLSVSASRDDVLRMFQAGIDGYLVKTSDEATVIDAIEKVLKGSRPVSPEVAGYLLDIDRDVPEAAGIERLTFREKEVTTLVARGYSYREIAKELSMSVKTLESHMHNIFMKLGLASRHELTRLAYETGFIQPDSPLDGAQPKPPRQTGLTVIVFTDIVGSTALTDQQGDNQMMSLMAEHDAILRRALAEFDGSEVKHTGDGVMAVFASVSAAISFALRVQEQLESRNRSAVLPLTVRIGISAGEPVADGDDLFGAAVQLAARLCKTAEPGGVMVSAPVRDLAIGKGYEFGQTDPILLKGFSEPIRPYQLRPKRGP